MIKVLSLYICLLFVSINIFAKEDKLILSDWSYKDRNIYQMQKVVNWKDSFFIKKLVDAYSEKPYEQGYSEIILFAIYQDEDGSRYFIFDINYVDDIQVVFKADTNNILVDNYLFSSFQ